MHNSSFSLLLATLALGALGSCHRCTEPQPACVGGTVVALSCVSGTLINVDAAYPIGAAGQLVTGQQLGNNVIAIENEEALRGLQKRGQRVYFTYRVTGAHQSNSRCCFAADGLTTAVPQLELSNVDSTGCQTQAARDM